MKLGILILLVIFDIFGLGTASVVTNCVQNGGRFVEAIVGLRYFGKILKISDNKTLIHRSARSANMLMPFKSVEILHELTSTVDFIPGKITSN